MQPCRCRTQSQGTGVKASPRRVLVPVLPTRVAVPEPVFTVYSLSV